jgi:outer membrane protein insertion porin family
MQVFFKNLLLVAAIAMSSLATAQTPGAATAPTKNAPAPAVADTTKPEKPADPYTAATEYEIGGIEVKGAQYTDQNAIINISGLSVGKKIKVPGDNIPRAIRSLWKIRLFTDVRVDLEKHIGDILFLTIHVVERPRLSRYSYENAKKSYHEDLNKEIGRFMQKGSIITEDMKANTANAVNAYYIDHGYLDCKTEVKEIADTVLINSSRLVVNVKSGPKVRISKIDFIGNSIVGDGKLKKLMKNTKDISILNIFSPSKLNRPELETDKEAIITYYNTIGLRDARILSDTVIREGNRVRLQIRMEEGKRYYFRDIAFKGNSVYATERLREVLGIEKGDVYDNAKLEQRLKFSQDNRDISSLYMDNGYLFFRLDPVETSIVGDSIDLEVRIFEGQQAIIGNVIIKGNEKTHEHVIRRELRTKPGEKFSRAAIIRSQRDIIQLGYFNAEKMGVATPNVNPKAGTVDVEYTVEEKPADQLELSAGWGGLTGGLIGTLGVTFNNFSMKNIGKPETWSPLPQGDGQKVSLRIQTTGDYYQSYNFSFTEPWLGGKKPNAFSASAFLTKQSQGLQDASNYQALIIKGLSLGIGARLRKPDDYFVSQTSLNLQNITLEKWIYGSFSAKGKALTDGNFNNFSINQTFSRNSIDNPLFPTSGSRVQLSLQFTPPYSLFKDQKQLAADVADPAKTGDVFQFVEYHKYKLTAEWYTPLGSSKFVLRTAAKMGILGHYNDKIGLSPFERFSLGGNGLSGQGQNQYLLGTDIISLRGYDANELAANAANSSGQGSAAAYNKFTVDVRYPFTTNPNSTIYALAFAEGGNAWNKMEDYNPFSLYRSAGLGLRVFLPMFGTLGFDYAVGLDKNPAYISPNKTFLDNYGKFFIILGFEPE